MTRARLRVLLALLDCTISVIDAVWLCWPMTVERLGQDVQAKIEQIGAVFVSESEDKASRHARVWQVWRLPTNRLIICSFSDGVWISFGGRWFSSDATYFRAPLTPRIQRYMSQCEWWCELDKALKVWQS
jgi:hypothetical protein